MSAAYTICREARRAAGLTQRELAERTGISPSSIARVERGRMEPTLDLLERLVEGCGQELRIQVTDIEGSRRASWGDLDFEDRLRAIQSASEFATIAVPQVRSAGR